MHKYLRLPHAQDCACSVCWSGRVMAKPVPCRSTPCIQCRPALLSKDAGRWIITPAFKCARHTPSPRPPKYWHVVEDIGKPEPFVPIREPFELTG